MRFKAIDFYSGIGGWTLGMKLSGIESLQAFEWWDQANTTHNKNFNREHDEIDIRKIDPQKDLKHLKGVNFIVGSPPCTQFSYANRGGSGDISDGLVDIYKFLEIVNYLKPKYWAMENVPRVAKILKKEIQKDGQLEKFSHLVKYIEVVNSAEYGVPQKRKRMIAGNFPFKLFDSYKSKIKTKTLKDVLVSLNKNKVVDINYGIKLDKKNLFDHIIESDLTDEEKRINSDAKTFHPIYNNMSFPEKLHLPARTITATCTRVSRESIIVESDTGYRRLTIRERGVIQGFPITFQFYGNTYNSKIKMIGNAIPPILTYYLFQSMLKVPLDKLQSPEESTYKHVTPETLPPKTSPDYSKRKFPYSRKFRYAIPNLRYGSAVRFELSNSFNKRKPNWRFRFFYGNSKQIRDVNLDINIISIIQSRLSKNTIENYNQEIESLLDKFGTLSSNELQFSWIDSKENMLAFNIIDEIGKSVLNLLEIQDEILKPYTIVRDILKTDKKKIDENSGSILIGLYLLSSLNEKMIL